MVVRTQIAALLMCAVGIGASSAVAQTRDIGLTNAHSTAGVSERSVDDAVDLPEEGVESQSACEPDDLACTAVESDVVRPRPEPEDRSRTVATVPKVGDARAPKRAAAPSRFQQFVEDTTGQKLPLHGVGAFRDADSLWSPAREADVPGNYVVGPGDEIIVRITGVKEINLRLLVDRGGRVTLPKVGTVSVTGVHAVELEPFLQRQFEKSLRNFTLSASLGAVRPIDIYVVGQALQPGRHTLSALTSFVGALFATGGPNNNGGLRHVGLVRDGKSIATLDVYEFLTRGTTTSDPRLLAGDTIVFPPAGPRVALMGDVHEQAIYELVEAGESLQSLLDVAGGLPVTTSRRRVSIERVDPQASNPRHVDVTALDSAGLSAPLRDGDVVRLFPIRPAFDNAVTLRGNVAAPLRYAWTSGMRIRDLIPDEEALIRDDYYKTKGELVLFEKESKKPKAGDRNGPRTARSGDKVDVEDTRRDVKEMLAEVNWEYAVVERVNREKLRTDMIPFHLGKAIRGDAGANLELQSGDVVTIFALRDVAVPQDRRSRLVRVEGEVSAPGIYQLAPDETLTALLKRIGGTTPDAYLYGLVLKRESVRRAQRATLDQVVRQLDEDMRAQLARRQANLAASGDAAQVAAFNAQLQSEQRLAEERLARIRDQKPEGRIALELDPGALQLPAIPLEDGDEVIVPSVPSFVTIVGAVNNENSLIWRKGRTVGQYLDIAGISSSADVDSLFVLRADGSVRARAHGFWSWVPGQNLGLVLEPGDTIIVPERLDLESGYTVFMRGLKDWTQVLANMGIAVATVSVLTR